MKKLLILAVLVKAGAIYGQDRIFTYTYQSGVLNKGQREIEVWNTIATGKSDYYLRLDHRTEFETGLGKNVQTSFYLNITSETNTVTNNSVKSLETGNTVSFSNEWKLKLTDAVADPLGIGLYGEYGIGGKEYEFEGKLILDKRIQKFTVASNFVYELEIESQQQATGPEWEKEHKAEVDFGLAYSILPHFAITTEHTFRNVFSEGTLEHSALYSGLGLSYSQENFWINFTVLPQVKSFKGQTGSSLNVTEFEKLQCRLLFSYAF